MNKLFYRIAIVLFLCLLTVGSVQAKRVKTPKMYLFGLAASFNDTIVHFTEVQEVDSVWLETKNNFLLGRELYSHQLRNYLGTQAMPGRTCVVFFNKSRAKLEKLYLKTKKLYGPAKNGATRFDIRYIENGQFHFKPTALAFENDETETEPKVRTKRIRKSEK
jgi:hypothetical protein